MSTKKLLLRELKAKGFSHQAALNVLNNRVAAAKTAEPSEAVSDIPPPPTSLGALLVRLHAVFVPSVRVGSMPAIGSGSTLEFAREQARHRSENPAWYADSGPVSMMITEAEYDMLLAAGATRERSTQRIRLFTTAQGSTFSVRCAGCHRWIHGGKTPHEGECYCGQKYAVTFDGEPNWKLPMDRRCMDCGKRYAMRERTGEDEPWHRVNEAQIACHMCDLLDGGAVFDDRSEVRDG